LILLAHLLRDAADGIEIVGGRSRKSSFDNVYTQPRQRAGYLKFLAGGHRGSGRLLAVT
jgi:hypothetical protein